MKFLAMTITALAALAAAAPEPHPPSKGCKPATYSCTKNPKTGTPGWQVCDVNHKWVVRCLSLSLSPFLRRGS